MEPEDIPPVTDSRALTTDRDRRHLARAGDVDDSEYYQAVSRVRRRIRENMDEDVELFHEHHSDLLGELRDVVCESTRLDEPIAEAIEHVTDALTELNRVRGQRTVQRSIDARDLPGDRVENVHDLEDVWNASENASLEAALEHVDAARELIADEVERSTSRSERNGN